jgi:hypothetical protein
VHSTLPGRRRTGRSSVCAGELIYAARAWGAIAWLLRLPHLFRSGGSCRLGLRPVFGILPPVEAEEGIGSNPGLRSRKDYERRIT